MARWVFRPIMYGVAMKPIQNTALAGLCALLVMVTAGACTDNDGTSSPVGRSTPSPTRSDVRAVDIFEHLEVPGTEFRSNTDSTNAGRDAFTGSDTPFQDYATRYVVSSGGEGRLARLEVMTFKPTTDDGFLLEQWAQTFAAGAKAEPPRAATLAGTPVWINEEPGVLTFVWWRFGDYVFLGTTPDWKLGRPVIVQLVRQTRSASGSDDVT